jgi:hypothetical protein
LGSYQTSSWLQALHGATREKANWFIRSHIFKDKRNLDLVRPSVWKSEFDKEVDEKSVSLFIRSHISKDKNISISISSVCPSVWTSEFDKEVDG